MAHQYEGFVNTTRVGESLRRACYINKYEDEEKAYNMLLLSLSDGVLHKVVEE